MLNIREKGWYGDLGEKTECLLALAEAFGGQGQAVLGTAPQVRVQDVQKDKDGRLSG